MNVNQLSKRLTSVAEYLPKGAHFADIGSDHAYLPCYVCINDPEAQAIAGEVNKGPFNSAVKEVEKHDLDHRVEVRLGDGLQVLHPEEVNQVVIAGMGGPLIRDILEAGKDKLRSTDRIITQPNIDSKSVRIWYANNDYRLVDETILEENGHIYEILVAEKGNPEFPYSNIEREKELWLGPYLLKERNTAFIQKCKEELKKKKYVLKQVKQAAQVNQKKTEQLQQEMQWLEEVLDL